MTERAGEAELGGRRSHYLAAVDVRVCASASELRPQSPSSAFIIIIAQLLHLVPARSFPRSIQSPIPRVRTAAAAAARAKERFHRAIVARAPATSAVAANPDADPGGAHATLGLVAFLIPIWRRERDEIESPLPAR